MDGMPSSAEQPHNNDILLREQIAHEEQSMAETVFQCHISRLPASGIAGYQEADKHRYREDVRYHLRNLAEAVALGRPDLYTAFVAWAKIYLAHHGMALDDMKVSLSCLYDRLAVDLPDTLKQTVDHYLTAGRQTFEASDVTCPSYFNEDFSLRTIAWNYMNALQEGETVNALTYLLELIQQDVSMQEIYLQVFQRSLYEIGRLWQLNQATVADEHYFTEVNKLLLAQLSMRNKAAPGTHGNLLTMAVSGELHEFGILMVGDFFKMAGWHIAHLGVNLPVDEVVQAVKKHRADLLAISATTTIYLSTVSDVIKAVREDETTRHLKILVGGLAFRPVPDLWQQFGADGYARDAREAVQVGERLMVA